MLQICISSFLVISIGVTVLLWLAFIAGKRADESLHETDEVDPLQASEEKVHLTRPIPSVDI
jgi:hypothetical protein